MMPDTNPEIPEFRDFGKNGIPELQPLVRVDDRESFPLVYVKLTTYLFIHIPPFDHLDKLSNPLSLRSQVSDQEFASCDLWIRYKSIL
jgi:hypothetical protein